MLEQRSMTVVTIRRWQSAATARALFKIFANSIAENAAPLTSQITISKKRSYAFTEHGANMAANILKSPRYADERLQRFLMIDESKTLIRKLPSAIRNVPRENVILDSDLAAVFGVV